MPVIVFPPNRKRMFPDDRKETSVLYTSLTRMFMNGMSASQFFVVEIF